MLGTTSKIKLSMFLSGIILVGFGCSQTSPSGVSGTIVDTVTSSVVSPVITYPTNGVNISDDWQNVYVKGTATPGNSVLLFRFDSEKDLCVTKNDFAAGGSGEVSVDGNFSFQVAPTGLKKGANTFVVFDPNLEKEMSDNGCAPKEMISNVVTFTFSGEINKQ